MKAIADSVSRRTFLIAATGALAAPSVFRSSVANADSKSLFIASWGGSWEQILSKVVTDPFSRETGIKVTFVPPPDLAKVKAQQLTGNVGVDVHNATAAEAASGSASGYWQDLDLSKVAVDDLPIAPTKDIIVPDTYVCGIAWNPAKYPSGKHPTTFAEYFDVGRFPGRRTFQSRPNETLEAALLADGVEPKDVYPLDLDRAFAALDRVKSSVVAWVSATPQLTSLLQTGEVDFGYAYSNRVKATTEGGGGAALAFSFDQNLLAKETLVIPKGAPNSENAMRYIAYYMRPEVLARVSELTALVPNSRKAMSMLSPEIRKWMPSPENPKHLVLDGAYWSQNLERVAQRFKEWTRA
ncbi:ABC transporter substrate-binding protein [Bradyrhizobium diazoefficiens]|nr:ABC transporter substrate-binding protein [Bradyrhizobium diazoefficiens]QQO23713.1 ABC transporter substrate-binding protein [Bradyrhizobium diazoefficiens]